MLRFNRVHADEVWEIVLLTDSSSVTLYTYVVAIDCMEGLSEYLLH